MKNFRKKINPRSKNGIGLAQVNLQQVPAANAASYCSDISLRKIENTNEKIYWLSKYHLETTGKPYSIKGYERDANLYSIDTPQQKGIGTIELIQDNYCLLTMVYVDPKYRGCGVYRTILSNTINGINIDAVAVDPFVFFYCNDFFTGLGFTQFGVHKSGLLVPMRKTVTYIENVTIYRGKYEIKL